MFESLKYTGSLNTLNDMVIVLYSSSYQITDDVPRHRHTLYLHQRRIHITKGTRPPRSRLHPLTIVSDALSG